MEITYYGDASFYLKGKKASVALNFKKEMPKADIAVFSMEHDPVETGELIDWPGEYEVKEVLVQGFAASYGDGQTILYSLEIDDIKLLYLPDLDHVPDEETLQKIGETDLLLLPVGGDTVLDAKMASKVYEEIEPKIVIPMQHSKGSFAPVGDFLKEVGKTGLLFEESLKVEKAKLPIDSTEFHVLDSRA